MKLLALETSASACSIALQTEHETHIKHYPAPMQQAKLILSDIDELLTASSLTIRDLDAIAYGCGPGSFTGTRIANSVAQALGFAENKPIIPVSSLAILAQTAYLELQQKSFLVALDARMNQIYWACYNIDDKQLVSLESEEILCFPGDIPSLAEAYWCGIGDGWGKYHDQIISSIGLTPTQVYPLVLPSAEALLPLAQQYYEKDKWVTAVNAIPVYLR